jgi:hypothetical protein
LPYPLSAFELGWAIASNGDLVGLAEQQGYDLLIGTDTNLRCRRNLSGRSIAILVLTSTSWPRIRAATGAIQAAAATATPPTAPCASSGTTATGSSCRCADAG